MPCADLLIQQIRSWAHVLTPQQTTGGGSTFGSRTLWSDLPGLWRSWVGVHSQLSSCNNICRGTWCRIIIQNVLKGEASHVHEGSKVMFSELHAWVLLGQINSQTPRSVWLFIKYFLDVLWYGTSSRITARHHVCGVALFQRLQKVDRFSCIWVTQAEFIQWKNILSFETTKWGRNFTRRQAEKHVGLITNMGV